VSAPSGVLLAGASGLIGGMVLEGLLSSSGGAAPLVFAPVRRDLGIAHARLHTITLGSGARDIDALEGVLRARFAAAGMRPGTLTSYMCALGTTIRTAGSQERFAAVDRDLVLHLGGLARRLGARQAILVSSVGADAGSRTFYLRIKGEAEQGLERLGFARMDLLRPSLLLGERAASRPGEQFAQLLAPLYNPLLAGPLDRYRAIDAGAVARAVVNLVGRDEPGRYVHEHARIQALSNA